MKKLLAVVLAITLSLAMLAGCGKTAGTTEVEKKSISPLPVAIDINNLNDCTVAVSLKKGDAFVDDSGKMQMKVTAFAYDLYDMVDIAALEVGDSIIRRGEEVEVTELERKDTGLININGGEENGGFDLISNDNTVYYEIGMDDAKAYFELGKVMLPVSTEFEYIDESDLDAGAKNYYPGDFLTDDAGIEYNFIPHNTSIVIENGTIIKMTKIYTP